MSEEEVTSLLEMITCKPPVTAAGVKFVSLGLCVLIACNSLTANPDNEKVAGLFIVTSHIFLHQNISHENYNYVRFHEVFFFIISVEWIQWLVQEESHFERATGLTASFGEMLLLMAIHFHSNQINAIGDLVCQTLGMKIAIRINR